MYLYVLSLLKPKGAHSNMRFSLPCMRGVVLMDTPKLHVDYLVLLSLHYNIDWRSSSIYAIMFLISEFCKVKKTEWLRINEFLNKNCIINDIVGWKITFRSDTRIVLGILALEIQLPYWKNLKSENLEDKIFIV